MNFEFKLTSTPITSTAGLAFIGEQLDELKFQRHLASICPHQRKKGRIPVGGIAKSMVGLICVGKPQFDAISKYRDAHLFRQALGIDKLASPEILRQRLQAMPEKAGEAFRGFTIRRLAAAPHLLSKELHGTDYSVVNVDVAPMDNSNSNKEGVSWTYQGYEGYAPIFPMNELQIPMANCSPNRRSSSMRAGPHWIGIPLIFSAFISNAEPASSSIANLKPIWTWSNCPQVSSPPTSTCWIWV